MSWTHIKKLTYIVHEFKKGVLFGNVYNSPKTAKITYKGIENKANICPVIITGNTKTKAFAWNVGIGNSTGIGFGAIS